MITPSKEFWDVFKETPGAFSIAEAVALINISNQAPEGIFIEFGSHKGKSSQCIAYGIGNNNFNKTLLLVEPEFSDNGWMKDVMRKLWCFMPLDKFVPLANTSLDVLKSNSDISFCFVDSGTHSDDLVMNETKMLEDKIISGGIIAYHDCFSQFTKVTEAYEYLLSTGKYEEIKINWQEIFDYLKENNISEDDNNSWHKYPELPHPPNFIGALKRK